VKVTSTLLDVNKVGKRVSAHQLASLLSSSIPELLQHIGNDLKVGFAGMQGHLNNGDEDVARSGPR
jgi:hypothetical protein